jgi:hypothetical protein
MEPAIVRARVEWESGGSGRDSEGRILHVRYSYGRRVELRSGGSAGQVAAEVEFDAESRMILPYCGEIALTGGAGLWIFEIDTPQKYNGHADWPPKRLTTFARIGTSFTVPPHHSAVGALNATVTGTLPSGDPILLSPTPAPLAPGTVISNLSASVTLFTLWMG